MARSGSPSPSSLALSNLRAITILIVVAFHCALTVFAVRRIPFGALLVGAPPRAVAAS